MERTAPASLKDRLLERARRAPLSFAAFMEAALYDPDEGFYARPAGGPQPIGGHGHFVTSPHVSAAFGDLLARQLAEAWDLLDRPSDFTAVELGAGDGTLAAQILLAAGSVDGFSRHLRYVAVERTAAGRRALARRGLEALRSLPEVGRFTGCVLANELLDNVPFHRLRKRNGRVVEVMVGAEGDRLVEVETQPTPEAMAALGRPLRSGEERPVSPQALGLVREVASTMDRGYAFLFDYAFRGTEWPGPVHGYRHHRTVDRVLDDPGHHDVTAAVDLDRITAEARAAGLQAWDAVSQREALLGLGFRLWAQGVRRRQDEAEAAGDWREANRLFAERSRASILIDEAKLGGLRLLALATSGLPAPAAALGDREEGC